MISRELKVIQLAGVMAAGRSAQSRDYWQSAMAGKLVALQDHSTAVRDNQGEETFREGPASRLGFDALALSRR